MTLFEEIKTAFDEGRRQFDAIMAEETEAPEISETYNGGGNGRVIHGDNLSLMANMIKRGMKGSLQVIYVDPPFFSNEKYQASAKIMSEQLGNSDVFKICAYDDRWGQGLRQYLAMLTVRFMLMKELLSDRGCLWVHLDWHVVHYVKIILDGIFGSDNFVNEVVWTYKSGGANKRSFARKHDTILFYSGGKDYLFRPQKEKSYNRDFKPYRFKGVEEFCDDRGWYTMVNMKDVWNIDMVGRTSSERNGYATQKPEKLLERIIKSCSEKGDLCADFFAGSGTLGAVCQKLGRKWIMCDESALSVSCQVERLAGCGEGFDVERPEHTAGECAGEIFLSLDGGRVVLEKYAVKTAGGSMEKFPDKKTEDMVKRYLQEDSLSLIKCWSVDFDYDGRIHRADRVMEKGERCCTAEHCTTGDKISVCGYDVMGNRFFLIAENNS